MKLTIHVDGGSRGNPGPAAAGVVFTVTDTNDAVFEAGYYLGEMTNNQAEYTALIRALEKAVSFNPHEVAVISDSQLMVRQISGEYKVKSAELKPLHAQAQRLFMKLGNWQIRHVKREHNQRADQLANLAMDAEDDYIALDESKGGKGGGASGAEPTARAPSREAGPASKVASESKDVTFSATIANDHSATCAMGCATNAHWSFGPTTPPKLCIHAAKAIFAAVPCDRPARMKSLRRIETRCDRCDLSILIELNHR